MPLRAVHAPVQLCGGVASKCTGESQEKVGLHLPRVDFPCSGSTHAAFKVCGNLPFWCHIGHFRFHRVGAAKHKILNSRTGRICNLVQVARLGCGTPLEGQALFLVVAVVRALLDGGLQVEGVTAKLVISGSISIIKRVARGAQAAELRAPARRPQLHRALCIGHTSGELAVQAVSCVLLAPLLASTISAEDTVVVHRFHHGLYLQVHHRR
mmetsp:Transcript_122508/g.357725  ORF Transcript_122508/g.357725 Transcript_122508/m.357725 type:complete len:211 (-) Transcript_122508:1059-1691(-)